MMGYENMEYLIDLRRADFIGSSVNELTFDPGAKWSQMLREMKQQNIPDDPNGISINGRDIKQLLGKGATIEIGRMKNALWMYVINHPNCNTTDKLLMQAKVMLNDEQGWNKEWHNKWII